MSSCKRTWQLLVYLGRYQDILVDKVRNLFFSCQDSIFCSEHKLPLSVDCFPDGKRCSVGNCSKKIKWSCPKNECFASCCSSHFKSLSRQQAKQYITSREPPSFESQPQSSDVSSSSDSESNLDDADFDYEFEGLTETGLCNQPMLESESSHHLPTVEDSVHSVPLHVLLNNTLNVFKRPSQPLNLSQKHLRYFQNFAASNPGDVVSFMQPEALFCPSVFFKQLDDGCFLGALPFFCLIMEFSTIDWPLLRFTTMCIPVSLTWNFQSQRTSSIVIS